MLIPEYLQVLPGGYNTLVLRCCTIIIIHTIKGKFFTGNNWNTWEVFLDLEVKLLTIHRGNLDNIKEIIYILLNENSEQIASKK